MFKNVLLIGAGQHAVVIAEKIADISAIKIHGFVDKVISSLPASLTSRGYKVLGDDSVLHGLGKDIYVHLCLGADLIDVRYKIISDIRRLKIEPVSIIHPSAYVAPSAVVGNGSTILVGAMLNTNAKIGEHCCINTRALIEHDCVIGENVFVQPGSIIAGDSKVGDGTVIGMGASVRQKIRIGKNCIIGGGAFVCKDIPDNSIAYGVPARVIGSTRSDFNG